MSVDYTKSVVQGLGFETLTQTEEGKVWHKAHKGYYFTVTQMVESLPSEVHLDMFDEEGNSVIPAQPLNTFMIEERYYLLRLIFQIGDD